MQINISEKTFLRLQAVARPLIESVDDVINRLIDANSQKGLRKWLRPNSIFCSGCPNTEALRGFQRELGTW